MRLPPLNALRAFEAAARHESFVGAAAELHVSQGAISRHVKLLEARLGVALFHRRAQGIELTGAGRTLLPELTASFERMARALGRLTQADREIRVIAAPTFAMRWLVPRLRHFRDLHPELRVSVGIFRRASRSCARAATMSASIRSTRASACLPARRRCCCGRRR